jgi:hypothetical protein
MERTFETAYTEAHPCHRSRTLDGRRSVLTRDEDGTTVLRVEKFTQIKPGALVVWGLVSKEVHAEVLHELHGYDRITRQGFQIAKLWNTGLLVAVRPAGGACRWGKTVTRVEVREITTEVEGETIVAGLGDRLHVRNPVTHTDNLN